MFYCYVKTRRLPKNAVCKCICTYALQCECRAFKQIFQNFMFKGKSITGLIMYKLLKGTEGLIYVQCSFKDSCIKYFVSKCSHCTTQHYGQTVLRFHGKPQVPRNTLKQQAYFANYNSYQIFTMLPQCTIYFLSFVLILGTKFDTWFQFDPWFHLPVAWKEGAICGIFKDIN